MSNSQLHEQDFNLWLQNQIIAIKDRNIKAMDWENLLQEIEDMEASQKRALRSYYYKLIEHILKLRDWEIEKKLNSAKWRVEITNFRTAIKDILEDSPSLKNYLQENHLNWLKKVVINYQKNKLFKIENIDPIPLDLVLDEDFFP